LADAGPFKQIGFRAKWANRPYAINFIVTCTKTKEEYTSTLLIEANLSSSPWAKVLFPYDFVDSEDWSYPFKVATTNAILNSTEFLWKVIVEQKVVYEGQFSLSLTNNSIR
tara:strand:- start:393 stop:725 length:333 start_codon:yes stop_codon:yes gene_type:complete